MAMTTAFSICDVECQEDVVILTPTVNLRELEYDDFEAVVDTTLEMLENGDVRHVVIDFGHTEYFGSHTITSLQKLGKKAQSQGGKMVLARMSVQEQDILKAMALDTFWPICSSTEDATEAVKA
jgi:anti-anti-sigma factor